MIKPKNITKSLLCELTPEQQAGLLRSAAHYVANAERYTRGLKKIG